MKGLRGMINRWLVREDTDSNVEDIELAKQAREKVAQVRKMREDIFEDAQFPITSLLRGRQTQQQGAKRARTN